MTKRIDLLAAECGAALVCPIGCGLAWLMLKQGLSASNNIQFDLPSLRNDWPGNGAIAAVMLALSAYGGVTVGCLAYLKRRGEDSPSRLIGFTVGQAACAGPILLISVMLSWMGGLFGISMPPRMLIVFGALVFFTIGAYIGRVPPNPFTGIRNRWTSTSISAHDTANRVAGKLLISTAAMALLVSSVSLLGAVAAFIVGLIAALTFANYKSWQIWRAEIAKGG